MNKLTLVLFVAVAAFGTSEACQSATPVHCEWNGWNVGQCSVSCGYGTRHNTRTKRVHEKDGGSCSGSSSETVSCFERECPVHCEWDDWVIGECDKECGGGMRTNTRTEKQGAQHGGEECPGPASIEESCNVQECPVDCVWGDWEYDVCSAECGGGTQPMVRIKIQEAMFGGKECEGEAYAEQACNEQPCPVDCTWNDWELGECSVTCAGGTRVDTRTVATEAMHGGFCDPEGDMRVQECNPEACPVIHCEWDEWVIGACSAECGVGTRTNTRVKLVEELNGGTCTGQPEEIEECMDVECPVHCEWDDWVIGECNKECGGGMRTNTRTEKVSAEHGGEECPGPASVDESCNVHECPVDCEWSEFMVGECSATCGEGTLEKHRFELVPAMFGGVPCEGDALVVESCNNGDCPACPEEKHAHCATYARVQPSLCQNDWFTSAESRYACAKSCGLC